MWLTAAAGAGYAAVLAARLASFRALTGVNSDTVSPLMVSRMLFSTGRGTFYLSNHQLYNVYLVDFIVDHLPGSTQIYWVLPYAVWIVSLGLLAYAVSRIGSRPQALTTFVLGLLAPSALLYTESDTSGRFLTTLTTVLFAASLIWILLPRSDRGRQPRSLVTGAVLLGIAGGMGTASDPLLGVVALLPLAGTGIFLWATWRDGRSRTLCFFTLGVALVSGLSYVATNRLAQGLTLRYVLPTWTGANQAIAIRDVTIFGDDVLASLGGFLSYSWNAYLSSWIFVLGMLVCLLIAGALVRVMSSAIHKTGSEPRDRTRIAFCVFWMLSAFSNVVLFLATNTPDDTSSVRYLLSVLLAFAAVAPLALTRTRLERIVLVTGVLLLALGDSANLIDFSSAPMPSSSAISSLVKVLSANHVSFGYGDYWYANVVTYDTGGRITILPVGGCGSDRAHLCPQLFNASGEWFTQPPRLPVAVIVSSSRTSMTLDTAPSRTYGTPAEVLRVGMATVYIFDGELKLGPPLCIGSCPVGAPA